MRALTHIGRVAAVLAAGLIGLALYVAGPLASAQDRDGADRDRNYPSDERISPPAVPEAVPVPTTATEATTLVPLSQNPGAQVDAAGESGPGNGGAAGAVDERVRFGVSLSELEKSAAGAVVEVMWSHAETGADGITGVGFSIREAGEDLLVTVLPQLILKTGGEQMLDRLRVDVRTADATTWPAELLLLDKGTGVGVLRVGGEDRENADKPTRYRAGNRLRLLRGDQLPPATVVFGFQISGRNSAPRCVAGRIAGRDSRYLGESLPTSLFRLRMHMGEVLPGGPLIDEAGSVVALLTDRPLEAADEIHAVPLAVLRRVLRDLGSSQKTGVGWIGATFHMESSTPQIVGVRGGSPASRAGLRSGDIVVSIAGQGVETLDELADEFYYLSAGEQTQIEVLRGLEKLSFPLVPASRDRHDLDGDGVDDLNFEGTRGGAASSATVRAID